MQRHLANSAMNALVCLAVLAALTPTPAAFAAGPEEVDESRLVPVRPERKCDSRSNFDETPIPTGYSA
jgi:hypothetical protein